MKKWIKQFILFSVISLGITHAFACTDFRLKAKDNTVVITRSMEFSADMQSNLRTSPRGRLFTTTAPDGKSGLSWKAKYGYVFLDAMNVDTAVDGMNEEGLTIENLYLPGFAEYQTVPAGQDAQALSYINFADWVLSNFKTVDEVRQALPKVFVFAQKVPGMGDMIFPLHFSIFEASGKGIVVEYVGGKLNIYDHIGVLTNSPTYDWQLKNIQNYLHLSPLNPPSIALDGVNFIVNGQGFGMIGLPGDISPPSRFVKMVTFLNVALPAENTMDAINIAEHIINNVDIFRGVAREPSSGKYSTELTQWVVFKDLTNKVLYYRTYGNLSLHAVSLSKLNFAENAPRLKMPIASKEYVADMTDPFLKSTQ